MEEISSVQKVQEWINLTNGIITIIIFIFGGVAGYGLKTFILKKNTQKNIIKNISGSGNKIEQNNINESSR